MITRHFLGLALFGMTSASALFAPQTAFAVDCRICETYDDPTALFELSSTLNSSALRHQIRGWVAEHRPDTAGGLAGQAWMASAAGDEDAAVRLYQQALAIDPALFVAANNLSIRVEDTSGVDAGNAIMLPLVGNPDAGLTPMWNVFFNLYNGDRQDEAFRYLETWESDGTQPRWVPAAIRGQLAVSDNDRAAADAHFLDAMQNSDVVSYVVFDRWLGNRRRIESGQRASKNQRQRTYDLAMEFAARAETPMAYEKIGLFAREHMNDISKAFFARREGIAAMALPELVAGAFFDVANYYPDYAFDMLERGLEDFPYNYDIAITELSAYSMFRIDRARADAAATRGLANTTTGHTVAQVGSHVLANRARLGDYDSAPQLMDRLLPQLSGGDRRSLVCSYLDNRIDAKDLTRARQALADCEAAGASSVWVAKRADQIAYFSGLVDDRDQWLASQPFLRDWEARFGESLRAAIQFETGQATILPESFDVIETAADALNAPGGEDYVFQIEGHTDNRGSDAVNFPLSAARAAAVKDALVGQLGLDAARIQTRGFGPGNPVAPNATEAGRQENRRVEIRPMGNVNDPQVATPGAYDFTWLDISKDGRIAVMGNSPTQVWDLERNVILHEISAGLDHKISPNGRYLASASSFERPGGAVSHTLYLYDLRSGKLVDLVALEGEIGSYSWSPFSDRIAFSASEGYIRVYDMAARAVTGVSRLTTARIPAELAWTNDGATLVAKVGANQGDMYLLDPDGLGETRVIPQSGWFHAMGQDRSGRYLIASRNNSSFTVWDRQNDWAEVASGRLPMIARKIYTHPTEPWVLMYAKFDADTNVLLMDLTDGSILARSPLKIEGGGFTPDGDRFITGSGDELLELDTRTLEVVARRESASSIGRDVHVFDDSGLVLSSDASGSAVWSLQTGRRVHVFDAVPDGSWLAVPNRAAEVMAIRDDKRALIIFDSAEFTADTIWQTEDEIADLTMDGTRLVVATVPAGSARRGAADPQITLHVIDLATMETLRRITTDIVTGPMRYDAAYNYRARVDLEGDSLGLVTSYSDGLGHSIDSSALLQLFDVQTGAALPSVARNAPIEGFSVMAEGAEVRVRGTGNYSVYDVATARSIDTAPYDPIFSLTLEDGRKIRWFWDRVTLDDKVLTFPMSLRSLSLSERNNVLVGQTHTSKIHFIDLSRLETALTIMPFTNGEWIAYTPAGNYTASLQGTEGVYWTLGDNYLPFDALANQFSRPSLVQDLLRKLTAGALTDEDVRDPKVEPDTFDAPYQVEQVTPARLTTEEDSMMIELKVTKDSPDLPDPEFRYVLNGRQVVRSRGFEEESFFEDSETVTLSRRFDLRPGANTIEASLIWNGAEVSTFRVEAQREMAQTDVQSGKGALWFFGVGVSEYENPAQNLEFAAKDATALAELLQTQSRDMFSQVHTKVLTDAEATERDVRIEMNEFLAQSAPDDVVIVFIAGHGVTDEEQNLYFVTHDADLARPYTGMEVERFRSVLENRPLNQSALLLIDICHSGAAGRVVSEDAVQKLAEGTGAIVFSSSSGSGLAYEDSSFGGGHGAFTAALLEALRGMADADTGNRDGQNSLQEMVIYTSSEVPRLTQGLQRPTIPMMAQGIDYGISMAD
ncbi:OmpA family protein [Pseudooceanicola algae]|uniref:Peptidoglycan-associated lipoprotein n=1 Tax=Pseudooceanicola algae TaxID=1537215 RepID=A0A418SLH6_9RHOB|nr:OmpA family protein [Pseudooceanicola algae]QPM90547.1 Peptidoglycan-associated lipoprotein [Pseudooceanicola algae]